LLVRSTKTRRIVGVKNVFGAGASLAPVSNDLGQIAGYHRRDEARCQLQTPKVPPGLIRNAHLARFLRFVVQAYSRADVKETVIGVEIFDRAPGYDDTRSDAVMRMEAGKLRARLAGWARRTRIGRCAMFSMLEGIAASIVNT
jgi:hypothetical protein